jgi:hypothetical protein
MPVRISLETSVTGHFKGLVTELKSFLKSRGIGCFIQTADLPDETRITHFLMEGESATLFVVKEALDKHLKQLYPEIEIAEWVEKESTAHLAQSLAIPAAVTSSGYAEIIAQGKPRSPPEWKTIRASGPHTVIGYLRDAGYAMSTTESAVSGLPKAITVSYKDVTAVVNAGNCATWMNFVALLKENQDLVIEKDLAIERVYYRDAGKKKFVRDIDLLKEDIDYYVEEKVEKKEVVSIDLQGFYEKLKIEEELDDKDIEIIRNVFADQRLRFKQLMATGKLEITDEDLDIKQGGLRTAILSAIENLMKD